MVETDKDKIIECFLKENKKEIDDFGFSRRVMHRLSRNSNMLANVWILFCSIIAIALFIIFDGVAIVQKWFASLLEIFIHGEITDMNSVYFCLVFLVLIGVWVRRLHWDE